VAGAPGFDHIQPFMAERLGLWEKYGVRVEFMGGNYVRSNQMMSIGDYDAGYNQYASAIRYASAGIENVIVAASSANAAMIVGAANLAGWAGLRGRRFGIVTRYDVQWLTLTHHILPRFGLRERDVQLAAVPVPEVASALLTGDIAGAFPFEPYGTVAVQRGAKLLLPAAQLIDKTTLQSDMLRNGLVFTSKFLREHPELAKRIVWAHLDAVHLMRTEPAVGIDTLRHYTPSIERSLLEESGRNCSWEYNAPPRPWIEALMGWMKEDRLLQRDVTYAEMVNLSMAEAYPGYPGHEKL
jgi:NitT/TauT family transport system substrate-binding protein